MENRHSYEKLIHYNDNTSGAMLTTNNEVEVFTDGEKKFADLRLQMEKAKHYIYIQYYIIKPDEVFASMIPILMRKAAQGVEIRILYDRMGGRFMPKQCWEKLREAGIRVSAFCPRALRYVPMRINYRNHRKIVVIDGRIGYIGGFNIGREYISKEPRFGYWRDTHLRIMGDAVYGLETRFAMDWKEASGEDLRFEEHYVLAETARGEAAIQIISSGPDTRKCQIRNNYLELFYGAAEHIYIQTPYFVPDDAVLSALKMAAESGVDVRLMIPCKPDHPFVYWATCSYMGQLLMSGARCFVYENGFLHAKGVMADGQISCCGTANLDIRSFRLNFEVNAVIYDADVVRRLEMDFLKDMEVCREITAKEYQNRGLWMRVRERGSRLLSPLL